MAVPKGDTAQDLHRYSQPWVEGISWLTLPRLSSESRTWRKVIEAFTTQTSVAVAFSEYDVTTPVST
jgi:hypothetical protein